MIQYRAFTGERPIIDPINLGEGEATYCRDCYLHTTGLDPLCANKVEDTGYGCAETLYRAGEKFIHMCKWTDFVRSPIIEDAFDRIYYTQDVGCEGLYVTDCNALTDNISGFNLSNLEPPGTAAGLTLIANGTNPDSSTNVIVTYLTTRNEETAPSPVSVTIDYEDCVDGAAVTLPSTTNADITTMIVYMSINGDYYAVAEVPATQSSLTLNPLCSTITPVTGTVIGTILQSGNYDPAPDDLLGLTGLPNGVLAGFTNDSGCEVTGTVHFSEPFQPHAWPTEYRFKTRHKIIGLATIPEGVLVLTEGKPTIITGSTPDVMDEHELESYQSCLDKRSIVEAGDSVLWSSPDGIAVYGGRSIKIISDGVWSRKQWQAIGPDDIIFGLYENRLVIYPQQHADGIMYDLRRNDITRLSEGLAHAVLHDVEDDALWVSRGDNLEEFMAGDPMQGEWIGRSEVINAARTHNSARLVPEGETLMSIYRVDNELQHENPVAFWSKEKDHQRPFRIGSAQRSREVRYGFKLIGRKRLRLAMISEDMRLLA